MILIFIVHGGLIFTIKRNRALLFLLAFKHLESCKRVLFGQQRNKEVRLK